jgi:molybdate transport system ATP-binding protein
VARLADRLVLVQEGRIQGAGPLTEMTSRLDPPLVPGEEAEAVIEAEVAEQDPAYGLTRLTFSGGELTLPASDRAPGTVVRVGIRARDVSLALEPPGPTSILNVVPATVTGLAEAGEQGVLVRLEAGGTALLALVTRKSCDLLGLAPGMGVFAQIKAAALAA